jgi:hypothetical protein
MSDEFANNVAQKFPNTVTREVAERPWDVVEPTPVSLIKRADEPERDKAVERIDLLYSELRSSLTLPAALEYDLRRANGVLDEINRVKAEVEKIIEMLRVMEEYMKERIK